MFSWTKLSDLKKNTGVKTKRSNGVNNGPKKGVTFSNKTRVRNQYESVNPETGEHQVNLNEYNANASKNDEMPGYSMAHPKFVPHSKSSLVQATSQFNNSGWTRSIGSVGPNVNVNRSAAFRSKTFMKNRYGNAWVNAEAQLEDAYKIRDAAIDLAIASYNKGMAELEADFLERSGVQAPTVLEKMIDAEIEKRLETHDASELASMKYEMEMEARQLLIQVPFDIRIEFENRAVGLRKKLEKEAEMADLAVSSVMNMVPSGKPYNKRVKRTLKNRLSTAHVIASMAPPDTVAVPKKKKIGFF